MLSRIKTITDLEEVAKGADLVIEAIIEDMQIKKDTFRRLDGLCTEHTIFASNTSCQPINEFAAAKERRDKLLGMH